jgi:alpha-methylacyl-CoA racemase
VAPTGTTRAHYEVYQCADGQWVSVAANEKRFHAKLLELLDISPDEIGEQTDPGNWSRAKSVLAKRFITKTRDEWCVLLEGKGACFSPVLTMKEAPDHHHLTSRATFINVDGVVQPAPAPRFSRTRPGRPRPPQEENSENAEAALTGWISPAEILELRRSGILG